jgi:hypothetical protein
MRKYKAYMEKRNAMKLEEQTNNTETSISASSTAFSTTNHASRKEISRLRKFFAKTKRLSFGSLSGAL